MVDFSDEESLREHFIELVEDRRVVPLREHIIGDRDDGEDIVGLHLSDFQHEKVKPALNIKG